MKTPHSKITSILLLATVLAIGIFTMRGATAGPGSAPDFSGAWDFKLGDPMAPITAYFSFHRDGIVLETDSPLVDPNFGGFAFSNGHGEWQRVPGSRMKFAYQKLQYDPNSTLVGFTRGEGRARLGRNGVLTGEIEVSLFDTQGQPVGPLGTFPFTATRIEL